MLEVEAEGQMGTGEHLHTPGLSVSFSLYEAQSEPRKATNRQFLSLEPNSLMGKQEC